MPLGIEAIAMSLPSREVTSEQIASVHGFGVDFITGKLGIRSRRQLSGFETTKSLASSAVVSLMQQSSIAPHEVELLACVSQTSERRIPHLSAELHGQLGMPHSTLTFDLGLGCSGYVAALDIVAAVMERNGFSRGLLVTVDAYSRIVDPSDRDTAALFGDAATATLVSSNPLYEFGSATHGTAGELSKVLETWQSPSGRETLRMDGREIFNFAMREVTQDIESCLKQNGVSKEALGCAVFHQANAFMMTSLARRLEIAQSAVVFSLEDVGNTTSSSIPIALSREVFTRDSLPSTVLISGFGVGLAWASNILFRKGS